MQATARERGDSILINILRFDYHIFLKRYHFFLEGFFFLIEKIIFKKNGAKKSLKTNYCNQTNKTTIFLPKINKGPF